ncbi:Protein trichome birefringence-like [Actinidia chinensis var. chinensis]|uniref:Protein trichome birefringence-like n=1 Tax=Actinidia chinensis var. chinensis TaxID=1590841 RepID=A0A2R6RKN2_ACTCC|nr:Protein trichome birefringence-like [Actinidia chinensis var. chinensis]
MKPKAIDDQFPTGKNNTPILITSSKIVILTLFLLTTISLYIHNTSPSLFLSLNIISNGTSIPHYQKTNASLHLRSHAVSTNISTTPLRSPEIVTNGSTPQYPESSSTRTNWSPEIIANGSTILYQRNNSLSSLYSSNIATNDSTSVGLDRGCNIFKGEWVPNPMGPYYTNETKCEIDDRQNCMKFGRPDTEFMKWRWKPYKCELPLFDAVEFLELVRGKNLAFLGDSVGRNQMQSLVCLLASAVIPQDISYTPDKRFRSWLYADYNFTIISLWSPLLVKARETDEPQGYLMNLYLDEPDEAWTSQIENIDILIISAGQWFARPFVYYQKGEIVGCHICNKNNIKELDLFYTYKMAFRTAFQTLLNARKFRALTFLRTFSASQFENGEWNTGGDCRRKKPFTRHEMRLDWYNLEFYKTQVKELKVAERRGKKRGLKFKVLETTEAMLMRPDGHPSHYGHWPQDNNTAADCVHWCMPGPVDTWNEFLLQMLKKENEETSSERKMLGLNQEKIQSVDGL